MNTETSSLADLLKQLRDNTTELVREEAALAKAELSEKAAMASRNAASLIAGALLGYSALIVMLFGVGYLLRGFFISQDMGESMATFLGMLITGAVVAVISLTMVSKALKSFKRESLAPRKTIQTLKEDKEWVQNKLPS